VKIRVLGAHNCESYETRLVTLLVDDILALDAGGLTSGLSIEAQLRLKAVLLTHGHYDHIRDIPALAMNAYLNEKSISIYSSQPVREVLSDYLLNGNLYPNFFEHPPGNPALDFNLLKPGEPQQIGGYTVLAVKINHSIPAFGYQITSEDGKILFYTGDTGSGLENCWSEISPQLLICELTASDRFEDAARQVGHLTPDQLKKELIAFRRLKGYLPAVVLVHMNPLLEKEIEPEISAVAEELGSSINLACEGMEISV
jgi:ribonuclease BN (tRNA processing enzyme)